MVVPPTLQDAVQKLTDEYTLEVMLLALSLTTQVTESRMLPDDDESVAAVSTPLVMLLSQG